MTLHPVIDLNDGAYHFHLHRGLIEAIEFLAGRSLGEVYQAIGRAQFHDDDSGMDAIDPVDIVRHAFLFATLTSSRSRAVEVNGDAERLVKLHLSDDPTRARVIALALIEPWLSIVSADELSFQRQASGGRPVFETAWTRSAERMGVTGTPTRATEFR
jgi:hypothetical protein